VNLLERIIAYVFSNVGTTLSASAISKYFKSEKREVAPETILNYLKYCEDAFMFYSVQRGDLQGKKLLKINEKYYVADHGIRESVFGGNMRDINLVLENIVYLELLRRGYEVCVGQIPGGEIDFVATRREEKLYVQIAQKIESPETEKREYGRLLDIRDNHPKYVLRTDEFAGGNYEGIITMHVADFLLSDAF